MPNLNSRIICTIVAGLASGSLLMAQQTFGSFKGRVTEKGSGAAKAGVTITIENVATGYNRTTQTGSDGSFRFQVVPLGNYKIIFKSSDSTASMIRTSQLGVETDASVSMAAAAAATVTVVATADTVDQVNTTSAEVGVNVSAERLESLPVLSRNVVSAAVLAPGVQLVQGSAVDPTKKTSTYMSTGEGQGRGTNFNIDGGDNNSTDVGGYVSPIPMDAIGEFQVVTNQYKAEFGRSNAGFMNVVSKAGTNTFGGIFSGQFTNQSMRARSTDEGVKKDNVSKVYGLTVTGPILKDKLFYMASVERRDDESTPATFASDAIVAYPELGTIMTKTKETMAYLRFDWAASQAVNLTFTYGYDKNETPDQVFPGSGARNNRVDPAMLGTGLNKTSRYGVKATTNFTSNLIWESNLVYFDYANQIRPHASQGVGNMTVVDANASLTEDWKRGTLALGRVGLDPNAFQNTGIKRTQWRNDFTYVMGDHFFKAGIDLQNFTYAEQILFYPETGPYAFTLVGPKSTLPFGPSWWGSGVVANQNVLSVSLRAYGLNEGDKIKQYGFYVQDDWTISPKLSVYAGIRADKDTAFDFLDKYQGLYAAVGNRNPAFLHGNTVPKNKTYMSPRLQVVYKPKGDDSVTYKFGYGRFVANVIDNVTGFSRALGDRVNGLTRTAIGNRATSTYSGGTIGTLAVDNFSQGTILTNVNGHDVVLQADLTPYNYVNNVNNIRDYFRSTVDGWCSAATANSQGKQLMASDFEYPTTDTVNLGGTFKMGEHQNLDIQYIWSHTKNASAQFTADGSDPRAWSPSADGLTFTRSGNYGRDSRNFGDNVFVSNQSATSHQLQVKWSYTSPKFTSLVTFVAKEMTSSYGGSARTFDQNGSADFYGAGCIYPFMRNPERKSQGTEAFSGSFALGYNFDFGTKLGLLGTWHSGKYYDIYQGYNSDLAPTGMAGAGYPIWMGSGDLAHPSKVVGTGTGKWNMDIGLRLSHNFKFGKTMAIEPFIQISNILNNYDYGSNYTRVAYLTKTVPAVPVPSHPELPPVTPVYPGTSIQVRSAYENPDFGKRGLSWQANQPRTAAFGFRFVF